MNDSQAKSTSDPLLEELQSAIAALATVMAKYHQNEAPLKLGEQLQALTGVIRGIRWKVLTRELTTVLHDEDLPETTRNKTVEKIFQLVAKDESP